MEIGELIDYTRKQKGLTIKDVCGDFVSRSVYNRFVNNRADTSVTNLTYMLSRINVYFDELKAFDYPKDVNVISQIMDEVRNAFMKKDVEELIRLESLCNLVKGRDGIKYEHLSSLCQLLIARLKNETLETRETKIYQYLINMQTWTRYELVLFNNCMFAFTPEFIEITLEKALLGINHYKEFRDGKSECFRMLTNAIVFFIQHDRMNLIWKYIDKINSFSLEEEMFFEKNLKLVINGIWECLRGNKKGEEMLKKAQLVCKYIGADKYYKMNEELIEFIKQKYEIKIST